MASNNEQPKPTDYCTCGIWVAAHDPNMKVIDGRRRHLGCIRILNPVTLNCHVKKPDEFDSANLWKAHNA